MFGITDRVLVFGVGRSGMAAAEVLLKRGIAVVAYDDGPPAGLERQRSRLAQLHVPLIGRDSLTGAVPSINAAVLSPGIPQDNAAIALLRRSGVPLYSEIELAYRFSPAPMIAVSGSKGKSTTTQLIAHLIANAGLSVGVGGNIGRPLVLEAVAQPPPRWIVAEVSSFQLEHIERFAPRISVLLNISADHLDRYPSMDDYAQAKYRIFENGRQHSDFVGNADDPRLCRLRQTAPDRLPVRSWWFSLDPSSTDADIVAGGGVIRWRHDGQWAKLMDVTALPLPGAHNVANAMAAALAARAASVPPEAIRTGLKTFQPLAHRLQTVARVDGVTWIDDSKATNPDAVVKALEACTQPAVLIAGGKAKRTDFADMGQAISRLTTAVVLIGESAAGIAAHIAGPAVHRAGSMREAVAIAAKTARPGQCVLLSPGCASFDMFGSAEQRGDVFARLARELEQRKSPAVP
ncbi:MAG: UDP-N-acetylmuramoyl-L-alanine--D-glutamate ligase [Candidatus Eremiobacteraeota bacterium]|nr:UDP-N-acetylmuramoyl-L-alanine--D-glutamate ligase [Candidatus Eremiobacteraeota bacterium]